MLLRDGRKLLGTLRSFDQFGNVSFSFIHFEYDRKCSPINEITPVFLANAVLEGACERVIVGDLYCDIPLGLYIIRGENVVLIGELVYYVFVC